MFAHLYRLLFYKNYIEMLRATLVLVILLKCANHVEGVNILGVMNIGSPSHSLWNTVLVNALAEKGHNLTVLIADIPTSSKDLHKNVHYVHLEGIYKNKDYEVNIRNFLNISDLELISANDIYSLANCDGSLKSKGLLTFLEKNKNDNFDLVLYDYTFGPCLLGLVHMYNYPPLVAISAFPYLPLVNKFMGGHFYPSYVSYASAVVDLKNNFIDRMYNHILYIADELIHIYKTIPQMDKMVRTIFPNDIPYLGDLEKLSTIALVGSHSAITKAYPLPQSIIEVGGLNVIDSQPLPKNIDDFIKISKKGAVFFSLGTNIKPKDLGSEAAEELLNAMEKFPEYNFLWKFDITLIKRNIPKNVLIQNFFQQRDILAHPNTKCFVTHSGGLSTQESIWFGVPMITIPGFIDQMRNSHMAVTEEIAVEIDFLTLNEEKFYNALNEILNNPKYFNNISIKSKIFRDRPMKPLETAIWWIEYVLRHPNPDHLKVPTLEIGFLAANSYDFVFLLVAILILIVFINVKIIKCLCCCKTKRNEQKKIKRN